MVNEILLKEAQSTMEEFLNIMSKIMRKKVIGIPKEYNLQTDEDLKEFIKIMQMDIEYWRERSKNL